MSIIRLLVEAPGVILNGDPSRTGCQFDMIIFSQAVQSRFLQKNSTGHIVIGEHGLKGMIKYRLAFNPQRRHVPTRRPNGVVKQKGSIQAISGGSFRDLWERQLPREMLDQLLVNAISHPALPEKLYSLPKLNPHAFEARNCSLLELFL